MNLEEFRNLKGLKQIELAQILGMKTQGQYWQLITDIENGKILSSKHALKIANYFHISLDTIYSEYLTQQENEKEDNKKAILLNLFNNMDETQKDLILQLAETMSRTKENKKAN